MNEKEKLVLKYVLACSKMTLINNAIENAEMGEEEKKNFLMEYGLGDRGIDPKSKRDK